MESSKLVLGTANFDSILVNFLINYFPQLLSIVGTQVVFEDYIYSFFHDNYGLVGLVRMGFSFFVIF